jgi:hypothetical protein
VRNATALLSSCSRAAAGIRLHATVADAMRRAEVKHWCGLQGLLARRAASALPVEGWCMQQCGTARCGGGAAHMLSTASPLVIHGSTTTYSA